MSYRTNRKTRGIFRRRWETDEEVRLRMAKEKMCKMCGGSGVMEGGSIFAEVEMVPCPRCGGTGEEPKK